MNKNKNKNKNKTINYGYDRDSLSALEAITNAQKLAFAPMLFQAALNLRESGILTLLDQALKTGLSCTQITESCSLNEYAVQLLLDVGLSCHVVYQRDDLFFLAKTGHYLLHDTMTRVNMDFTQDVCYEGMFHLKKALETETPVGLSVFGNWETIYPALSKLPKKAQDSWFAFDHFYSSAAFDSAFKHISILKPKHIYDVGGNTGKWALCCVKNDPDVVVTILDLPQQTSIALTNISKEGFSERIKTYPVDLLKATKLPDQADIWWMSQFLDCFSEDQIMHILTLIHQNMKDNSRICILETFWDRQPYEAGALSLNASSLYFTCMANGNSRFYHSRVFYACLHKAGFNIEQDIDGLGIGHTLLICNKA
ncbi:O-methyltransferase [Gammaproteobacteria bacterium]|nr:O-methyltransferase [Gammaproteobacteria bacterium]